MTEPATAACAFHYGMPVSTCPSCIAAQGRAQPTTAACAFGDPACPCQDGDVCHYVDDPKSETLAMTPPATIALRERIDWMVDEDPLKLRDALYAVLARLDAESAGAARQMAAGDYRLCPPDMLRVYCHDAITGVLGV